MTQPLTAGTFSQQQVAAFAPCRHRCSNAGPVTMHTDRKESIATRVEASAQAKGLGGVDRRWSHPALSPQ